MLKGHGGNSIELARQLGCSPHEIIDMSSNINPLGPPPGLIKYLKKRLAEKHIMMGANPLPPTDRSR